MSENAQNPAAQNPSKADTSNDSYEYETAWKGFNQILCITRLMLGNADAYGQNILFQLNSLQLLCTDALTCEGPPIPAWGKLSASDAVRLITPLAQQMAASPAHPDPTIFQTGNDILDCCKNIESLSGA